MAATLNLVFRAVDEISARFDAMTRSGEEALETFQDIGTSADGAFSRVSRTATETAESLDDTASAADRAADEVREYGEQSERAGQQGEEFGQRSSDAVKSLKEVLAAAGITVALKKIAEGFMECSEAAAEFETANAKIATIADTDAKSLGEFSAEIRAFSNETGAAATELGDATYQALSAGVNTADSVAFAGQATKLAVGGFTEAATAVDVLTTAINAYGLEASDATSISDMLITTQNLGKTTVDELAQSVGKVIPLASAYGVEMDNLSTAYAVMTANGIATAETGTYLKAMLNELGDTGSEVAGVLSEQTGQSFASLMEQGYSLGDVLAIIGEGVGNDATAFNALWSSTEAGIGALSMFNSGAGRFNAVLGEMQSSAGATESAYTTMANTTERSKQRMETAFDNLSIAVGDTLNPALTSVYDTFAGIFAGMSEFVAEHPGVVAAITAIAVGVGVFAAALAGYTLATNIASVATAAWNAILAMNPVVLIVMGVVALTAAVVALVAVLASQNDEYEEMTATSKDTYDQLQDLNAEYEEACAVYGETSEEASRLRYEMEELEAEFEANRQTVEEFVAECDALIESHNGLMDSYNSTKAELKSNELGTLALIQKLEDLATQNEQTAATEEQMRAIIQQLNAELPELALTYDSVTASVDATVEAMRKAAAAQAEQERQTEQQQAYVDLLKDQAALEEQIAKAEANLNAERERLGMYYDEYMGGYTTGWYTEDSPWANWTTDLDDYKGSLTELEAAYAENQAAIAEIEDEWEEVAQAALEAQEAVISYEDALSNAVSVVQEDLNALCEEYDAAYEAARESIDGQIGLFDTMKTESALSVEEMGAALQSQAEYLALYTENLQKASELGISDGLIQSLSDGSTESAGYIDAIIAEVERLGPGTEAANAFVEDFNAKFAEVDQAKDEFAANVAAMETDFDARMTEIEGRMNTAIDNMNMETDAAAAARETITAYCNTIRSMVGEAESAASAVASAAARHLGGVSVPVVEGNASGTTDAADVFVAGEEGPELIVGKGGSTVFPADETNRIISAVEQRPIETSAGSAAPETDAAAAISYGGGERQITLNINGGGSIGVSGGADRGSILQILIDNIKPVLMDILDEEILEEGELAYEY